MAGRAIEAGVKGRRPWLRDVAREVGIELVHLEGPDLQVDIRPTMGPGAAWGDFDENGHPDLVLVQGAGRPEQDPLPHRLFLSDGEGGFRDASEGSGLGAGDAGMGALAFDADILLMDEPLSSLDALTRERLQNLIVDIWQLQKITKVLVTHSIEEAVFLGQKIIVLGNRPARVLHTVDNPEAGSGQYRQSETFFKRCIELRKVLGGNGG
mgnify:CR=1 FL=1